MDAGAISMVDSLDWARDHFSDISCCNGIMHHYAFRGLCSVMQCFVGALLFTLESGLIVAECGTVRK